MDEDEDYVPLFDAIKYGDIAAVESFLQTPGVHVDYAIGTDEGIFYSPLNWAIMNSHAPIVEVLLAHGAAVHGPGVYRTPLQQACYEIKTNKDIVKLLLEHGADVDGMTADNMMTPLTKACSSDENLDIIQLLLNAGAHVNGGDADTAPLHCATLFRNIKSIELLIDAGADVNIKSAEEYAILPTGSTPLHVAATEGHLDCLNILLAAGADHNSVNARGETPLYGAAWLSSVDVINALLAAGCDPLHRYIGGRTSLQCLCEERNEEPFFAEEFIIITALVAAGDRSWQCVPTPCPGLEAAMVSVLQAAPDEMPELFKRLDEEMKKVVQEVLRVLHHHFSSFPHLKEHLLNYIFGFTTSV